VSDRNPLDIPWYQVPLRHAFVQLDQTAKIRTSDLPLFYNGSAYSAWCGMQKRVARHREGENHGGARIGGASAPAMRVGDGSGSAAGACHDRTDHGSEFEQLLRCDLGTYRQAGCCWAGEPHLDVGARALHRCTVGALRRLSGRRSHRPVLRQESYGDHPPRWRLDLYLVRHQRLAGKGTDHWTAADGR